MLFRSDPASALQEADVVLLLGAILPWHPPSRGPGASTRVAVLDENPLRTDLPYWGYKMDLCLTGNIAESLALLQKAIVPLLPGMAIDRDSRRLRIAQETERRRGAWREQAAQCARSAPIDTRWAIHELNDILPANAMVVEETITHRIAVHQYLDRVQAGCYFAGCIGGLGTGLGTALGVKVATPEKPVICLIGDGSFHYDPALAALGFCQEHHLPILIVLLNNHGYLSQKSGVPRHFPNGWAVRSKRFIGTSITPSPDYPMIARAYGGYGETVMDPSEVRHALRRGLDAIEQGQLALVEIRLQPVNPA